MYPVLTSRTAPLLSFEGEKNGKPSETVPNQAITAVELLRRFATGQPLGFKTVTPVYDDPGHTVPEFYKMSKLDRLHALQENADLVKDLSDEVKSYAKAEKERLEALQQQQQSDAETNKEDTTTKPQAAKE